MRYSYTYSDTLLNENFLFSQERTIGKTAKTNFFYQKPDHLGNVRVVVSDMKLWDDIDNDDIPDGGEFRDSVLSYNNYYAYHSIQPLRSWNSNSYRYGGAGGQEKDDEITNVTGAHTTAQFWEYDTRLGRRWNQDPKPNPSISNYAAFANNPVSYRDEAGDTIVICIFSPTEGEDTKFKRASAEMVKEQINDGVFILAGHADPEGFENYSDKGEFNLNTGSAVLNFLKTNPEWNDAKSSGKEITLILAGCNSATDPVEYFEADNMQGRKSTSIAQRVSKVDKDITVVGADGYVRYGYISEDRKGAIGKKGKFGIAGIRREAVNNGGWVKYKGGEKTGKRVVGWSGGVTAPKNKKPTEKKEKSKDKDTK